MKAQQRYLQRHIEPGLADCPQVAQAWEYTLVIPAYRESADLLQRLARLSAKGRILVILVLNRPDSDPDENANAALRQAACSLTPRALPAPEPSLYGLNDCTDLYVLDVDGSAGAIPAKQGVGLARKLGCDLAFKWHCQGAVRGQWICSSDADGLLPADYFQRLDNAAPGSVAAVYPLWHAPGEDEACNVATALYELRLHQYVLGLEYAGSPYAWHSLGSCLAVKAAPYAQVRGFPRRAGGEDFYLLNKLAKLGPIAKLTGECLVLQSRHSRRAPFGTGAAVDKIASAARPEQFPLFYHPACFEALRGLLACVPSLGHSDAGGDAELLYTQLHTLLRGQGQDAALASACRETLKSLGLAPALEHCRRQGKSAEQFLRQFDQWFDAFRTLKFIHGIRAAGWASQALATTAELEPSLWPGNELAIVALRDAVMRHWDWRAPPPKCNRGRW